MVSKAVFKLSDPSPTKDFPEVMSGTKFLLSFYQRIVEKNDQNLKIQPPIAI